MRLPALTISFALLAACSAEDLAVNSTSKVLYAAQPALQQEADYELARQAIPGALKTIEGFWVSGYGSSGAQDRLVSILTEGYCQYGSGFVEDDWEDAKFRKDLPATEYHNARATHIFTRCLNFSLKSLGARWQKEIFGAPEVVAKLVKDTGKDKRFSLLWASAALGAQTAGAVFVPIYPASTPDQVAYILEHAEIKFVFVSGKDCILRLEKALSQIPIKPRIVEPKVSVLDGW